MENNFIYFLENLTYINTTNNGGIIYFKRKDDNYPKINVIINNFEIINYSFTKQISWWSVS